MAFHVVWLMETSPLSVVCCSAAAHMQKTDSKKSSWDEQLFAVQCGHQALVKEWRREQSGESVFVLGIGEWLPRHWSIYCTRAGAHTHTRTQQWTDCNWALPYLVIYSSAFRDNSPCVGYFVWALAAHCCSRRRGFISSSAAALNSLLCCNLSRSHLQTLHVNEWIEQQRMVERQCTTSVCRLWTVCVCEPVCWGCLPCAFLQHSVCPWLCLLCVRPVLPLTPGGMFVFFIASPTGRE